MCYHSSILYDAVVASSFRIEPCASTRVTTLDIVSIVDFRVHSNHESKLLCSFDMMSMGQLTSELACLLDGAYDVHSEISS